MQDNRFFSYLCSVKRKILPISDIAVKIEYCQPISTAFKQTAKCYCFICSYHVYIKEKFSHGQDLHHAHHGLYYIKKQGEKEEIRLQVLFYIQDIFIWCAQIHTAAFYLEKYCFAIKPPEVCDRIATVSSARNQLEGRVTVGAGFLCEQKETTKEVG